MDPNLLLLFHCIEGVGGPKQIDFVKVGRALGIKDTAARMRYSRLVARLKNGSSMIESRPQVGIPMKRALSKSQLSRSIANKRKRLEQSGNGSDKESDEQGQESREVMYTKARQEVIASPRRTRGIKYNFKDAFGHDSDDDNETGSGGDEYGAGTDADYNISDETDSKILEDKPARGSGKQMGRSPRGFRRSGTPPLTPRRIALSSTLAKSPLTPPSTQEYLSKSSDFMTLEPGQMLPPTRNPMLVTASSPVTLPRATITEQDIMESIERDEEEEQAEAAAADNESSEDDEGRDNGEDKHNETVEDTTAHVVSSISAKSLPRKSFLFWGRSRWG